LKRLEHCRFKTIEKNSNLGRRTTKYFPNIFPEMLLLRIMSRVCKWSQSINQHHIFTLMKEKCENAIPIIYRRKKRRF
jgi:hypothetical protein